MATAKKSTTSKTARVMNLLSKSREEPAPQVDTPEEQTQASSPVPIAPAAPAPSAAPVAQAAAPAAAPAPVSTPHSNTPPIISSMQADSAISDKVFSALESALDDELGLGAKSSSETIDVPVAAVSEEPSDAPSAEPAPQPEIAPAVQNTDGAASAPVEQPAPVPVSDPVPVPVSEAPAAEIAAQTAPAAESEAAPPAASIPVSVEAQATAAPQPASEGQPQPPTRYPIDPNTTYVNVIESLVEEKAMKYINMFGLCTCQRCVADVKALALNRLDPKYVVMHNGEVIPRISLYEGQFSAAVTAQLLSACKVVMEHPRHDRE